MRSTRYCNLLWSLSLRGPGASTSWVENLTLHKLVLFALRGSKAIAVKFLHPFMLCKAAGWCQLNCCSGSLLREKATLFQMHCQFSSSGVELAFRFPGVGILKNEMGEQLDLFYSLSSCSFVTFPVLFIKGPWRWWSL